MQEDYPHNILQFTERFKDDVSCRNYLETIKWPDGFICPVCQNPKHWKTKRGTLFCSQCKKQTSVTVGTIFENTQIPLKVWFFAMWLITSEKNGISAMGLQRELGLKRYDTVWTILHKLRRVMVRPGRDLLSDVIEVDETYVGGPEEGLRGRQVENKAIVNIAVEVQNQQIGRIRLKCIPDVSSKSLHGFIGESVTKGSTILTDAWKGYNGLNGIGYIHNVINVKNSEEPANELLPHVHRIASLLKRWWLGTHQGAIDKNHIEYYLNEFVFRFNRRTSTYRGKLFYRLVQQAVQFKPVPCKVIAQGLGVKTPN